MTSHRTLAPQSAPAVLELSLLDGDMRALNWLATVRAAAGAGMRHLVLAGPRPGHHPAAQALWDCATTYGMHVTITATPPSAAADREPWVRIAADGIPRLVIPDGIPLHHVPPGLGTELAAIASPPVLRALEAAATWHPDAAAP